MAKLKKKLKDQLKFDVHMSSKYLLFYCVYITGISLHLLHI